MVHVETSVGAGDERSGKSLSPVNVKYWGIVVSGSVAIRIGIDCADRAGPPKVQASVPPNRP